MNNVFFSMCLPHVCCSNGLILLFFLFCYFDRFTVDKKLGYVHLNTLNAFNTPLSVRILEQQQKQQQ